MSSPKLMQHQENDSALGIVPALSILIGLGLLLAIYPFRRWAHGLTRDIAPSTPVKKKKNKKK